MRIGVSYRAGFWFPACGFRKLCRLISGNSGRLVKPIVSVFGGKIKMAGAI